MCRTTISGATLTRCTLTCMQTTHGRTQRTNAGQRRDDPSFDTGSNLKRRRQGRVHEDKVDKTGLDDVEDDGSEWNDGESSDSD